jgi:hypothetical protein
MMFFFFDHVYFASGTAFKSLPKIYDKSPKMIVRPYVVFIVQRIEWYVTSQKYLETADDHRRVFAPWFLVGMIGMMKAAAASLCDSFTAVAIFVISDWILMLTKDWVYFWSPAKVPSFLEPVHVAESGAASTTCEVLRGAWV